MKKNFIQIKIFFQVFCFTLIGVCSLAHAKVIIEGTRFVYPSNKSEITIGVRNDSDLTSLVQVTIEPDVLDKGSTSTPYFIVTPPLFRLDPKKGQALRIVSTKEPLATDRETLFWINILDIPPNSQDTEANLLMIAVSHKMKLFFRPKLNNDIELSAKKLVWKLSFKENKNVIDVENPTPYFVSLTEADVLIGDKKYALLVGMVPPFGKAAFNLKDKGNTNNPLNNNNFSIRFRRMNDYGGVVSGVFVP